MSAHALRPHSGQISVLGLARRMSLANPDLDYGPMRKKLITARIQLGHGVMHELMADRRLRERLTAIRNPETPSQIGTLT